MTVPAGLRHGCRGAGRRRRVLSKEDPMQERRYKFVYVPPSGNRLFRDRRSWEERRQHRGITRILFIDLVELWNRFLV